MCGECVCECVVKVCVCVFMFMCVCGWVVLKGVGVVVWGVGVVRVWRAVEGGVCVGVGERVWCVSGSGMCIVVLCVQSGFSSCFV